MKKFKQITLFGKITVSRIKKGSKVMIQLEMPESILKLIVEKAREILVSPVEEKYIQGELDNE